MSLFSFHLVETSPLTTLGTFVRPPRKGEIPGLHHAQWMSPMTLGAPILSPSRLQLNRLAVFAWWEGEPALEAFMTQTALGHQLATGWHVRLKLLRRWGSLAELDAAPVTDDGLDVSHPVVAVTVARLRLPQLLRFIHWGKPVEELVRDHPGTTLALAALRLPRTFCTFSVWRSEQEMVEMVHGRGACPGGKRHASAMAERARKDFHSEFTTLRFRAISEHGQWLGRGEIVPQLGKNQ